jgi:alpha-tubulin suppressor-like RCC1 family protein
MRRSRPPLFVLLTLSAACAERGPTAPSQPAPGFSIALDCTAQVRAGTLSCRPGASTGASRDLILGGQGVYVRLASSSVSYDGSNVFEADVTVQNLLGQPIGTTDGVTPSASPVRVFFASGPTATAGTGTVTVSNEDGQDTFLGSLEDYFSYPGVLTTEQTSAVKNWQFSVPNTVVTFAFTVYVSAPVPDEDALSAIDAVDRPLAVGGFHGCALASGGAAYCWGTNDDGQTGAAAADSVPRLVSGGHLWRQLTAGRYHSCAVTTSNQAYCWGDNQTGQLGTGLPDDAPAPVAVSGGLSWRQLHAGAGHTCGITTSDDLYCWGDGIHGQLGNGDSVSTSVPVQVLGGRKWAMVEAGTDHTCGVTRGGAAFCWGDNSNGELGDGGGVSAARPLLVAGSHSWAMISAGESFSCGVDAQQVAHCWGLDTAGQVGNGVDPPGNTPGAVDGGLTWLRVNAGRATACGVTTAGVPYCWGYNNTGEIGDNSTTFSDAPVAVSGSHEFLWIALGDYHTCAMETAASGGDAYCWGYNAQGQVGDNSLENRVVPVLVAGGHTWAP